jgi:hydrogenase maturation protease
MTIDPDEMPGPEQLESWEDSPRIDRIRVAGAERELGDRVRIGPARDGDLFDLALRAKAATIAAIEQDYEGHLHVAVTPSDGPGKDLGAFGQLGHRFFFRPRRVRADRKRARRNTMTRARILIAGIGNIFWGDDAFGSEVARRLAGRSLPEGVRVVDFGIRGLDLAYALLDEYDATILVDTVSRGCTPGTLYVIEPNTPDPTTEDTALLIEPHAMDPLKVLRLARAMGGPPGRPILVGCEPETLGSDLEPVKGLSAMVQEAIEPAIQLIDSLVAKSLAQS